MAERRIGLEQEFFLVDESGALSEEADEFLSGCRDAADAEGLDADSFAAECSESMIEVKTNPAATLADLSSEYLANLSLALRAGRELDLRLYPLATYPLPVTPSFREEPHYSVQDRTVGQERFLNAGRCCGVHLHIELAAGTIDPETVVSPEAPPEAREELLNLNNLATALDPAIIALTRSSPFYEGRAPGIASRTAFYRGSAAFGWEGVYTEHPELGALAPYAASVEDLIESQLGSHRAWLAAMERAGIESDMISAARNAILDNCWRPVRVNDCNTVELRGIDGNYPEAVLATVDLVRAAADRLRRENLVVKPDESRHAFGVAGNRLLVPGFEQIGTYLFRAAATEGVASPEILAYLDSVVEFAAPESLPKLRDPDGDYQTTEDTILRDFQPRDRLPEAEGLRLARQACNVLEEQVSSLTGGPRPKARAES